jgi:hypothetical protein
VSVLEEALLALMDGFKLGQTKEKQP